jgi:hypothetical protein
MPQATHMEHQVKSTPSQIPIVRPESPVRCPLGIDAVRVKNVIAFTCRVAIRPCMWRAAIFTTLAAPIGARFLPPYIDSVRLSFARVQMHVHFVLFAVSPQGCLDRLLPALQHFQFPFFCIVVFWPVGGMFIYPL